MISAHALPLLLLAISLAFVIALVVIGCALMKLSTRVKALEGGRS